MEKGGERRLFGARLAPPAPPAQGAAPATAPAAAAQACRPLGARAAPAPGGDPPASQGARPRAGGPGSRGASASGHGHDDAAEGEGEGRVEVRGAYERDESDVPPLAKQSRLRRLKAADHLAFLASAAPASRGAALRSMGELERLIYEFLVVLVPAGLLRRIWQFPQKSAAWLWARTGRITGSSTGNAVGHNRGTPVLKVAYEAVFAKFKGNIASEWGAGKEVYAVQSYVNDLNRLVTREFRDQRRRGLVVQRRDAARAAGGGSGDRGCGWFAFRNQRVPVPDVDADPIVEVRHYGLLIDPWNHQRGVSPDGVVFVNGVAVGILEIKCPFAKNKSLYVNIKQYYFDQLMCELYIGHLYWPTCHWLDFVVWAPQAFTVDTYTFDAAYFFGWFAPRELRYYFALHLTTVAERITLLARQEFRTQNPSQDQLAAVVRREFALPNPADHHAQPAANDAAHPPPGSPPPLATATAAEPARANGASPPTCR
jgi:hypothetical protein